MRRMCRAGIVTACQSNSKCRRKCAKPATRPAMLQRFAKPAKHMRTNISICSGRNFRRLGVLGDWENPYLTLKKEYEAEELRMFADIVDQGFVYRGKKPV